MGHTSYGKAIFQFNENSSQFTRYKILSDEKISNDITIIYEDHSGNLWFGTNRNGLIGRIISKKDSSGEKYEFTQHKNDRNNHQSISSNIIKCVYEDESGYLWIGTETGLNKFDRSTETFKRYRTKDGLSSNLIFGIVEDNHGNLWLGTNKGISKFSPETETFKNFDKSDGLLSSSYHMYGPPCKSDGFLFFGSQNGLTMFSPDEIKDNLSVPEIVISDFRIFNESVQFNSTIPLLSVLIIGAGVASL